MERIVRDVLVGLDGCGRSPKVDIGMVIWVWRFSKGGSGRVLGWVAQGGLGLVYLGWVEHGVIR